MILKMGALVQPLGWGLQYLHCLKYLRWYPGLTIFTSSNSQAVIEVLLCELSVLDLSGLLENLLPYLNFSNDNSSGTF